MSDLTIKYKQPVDQPIEEVRIDGGTELVFTGERLVMHRAYPHQQTWHCYPSENLAKFFETCAKMVRQQMAQEGKK